MKKKLLACILILTMLSMLTAACSSDKSLPDGQSGSPTAQSISGQSGAEDEVVTYKVFLSSSDAKKAPLDSPVHEQIRELYGVEFEWIIPATDPVERLGIMLAANDSELPDLIAFDDEPIMKQYIAAKKLLDLTGYLEEYAPDVLNTNFAEFYDRITAPDGGLYFLPSFYTVNSSEYNFPENTNCLWLKSEFFDETGSWDLLPLKTFDDVTSLLQKIQEQYPGQYPISLALGANGNLDDIIAFGAGAYGLFEDTHIVRNADGTLSYLFENEDFKNYIRWLNSLNQQGLLDIESPLISVETLKEKVVSDQAYSSIVWRYGTLRTPYISYQQSQGVNDKIMFKNYPVASAGIKPTFARGGLNIYTTGLSATVNMKNPEKFFQFYNEVNHERGHFNVMGIVNWDFDGENTAEETEGYNFVVMKEPNESGKRPILWSGWTLSNWDEDEDWAWQYGVENMIEFTYNSESAPPKSEFDILETMAEIPPDPSDALGFKIYEVDKLLGETGTRLGYWDFMRSMFIDTADIANLPISDDDFATRAALKVVYSRMLPRIIMATDDAAFEQGWSAMLSELEANGYKQLMDAVRVAYDERKAEWSN